MHFQNTQAAREKKHHKRKTVYLGVESFLNAADGTDEERKPHVLLLVSGSVAAVRIPEIGSNPP